MRHFHFDVSAILLLASCGGYAGGASAVACDRLTLVTCPAVEGGVLHGQGVAGGSLTSLDQATVPWAAGISSRA